MAEKSFPLSGYASLEIVGNPTTLTYSINLSKKPYAQEPVAAALSLEEWKFLSTILPSIRSSATEIWEEVQAGRTPSLTQVQRVISDSFLLRLNAYTAPNGNVYVTTGIRRYFTIGDGEMIPKKEGGVTLSYEELVNLVNKMDEINDYLSYLHSNHKHIIIHGIDDVMTAQQFIQNFWKMGHGKCRLVLEKPAIQNDGA